MLEQRWHGKHAVSAAVTTAVYCWFAVVHRMRHSMRGPGGSSAFLVAMGLRPNATFDRLGKSFNCDVLKKNLI